MRRFVPLALLTLTACAEMVLPDLTVPVGDGVVFGTDPTAPHPVLGVTVTDPLNRMRR
ncbi:MAG: hypothetical protein Q27BPR15_04115 [Rhodobacter sp. CACIA14H1]|nr:MAG: hypothetical protein Q27BPR15_04115 [Rhodobacter sp. CACIA14H1]